MTDENKTDEVTEEQTEEVTEETENDGTDENDAENGDADKSLGDPGKKAIAAIRHELKETRRLAKSKDAEIAALQAKINGTEAEHAAKAERDRITSDALSKANARLVKAEVRGAATGKLANPADALLFLDLDEIEVGDDGEIDSAAVASLIDDLLTERPYLAASGSSDRFGGSGDGGAKKVIPPKKLTDDEANKLARTDPSALLQAVREGRY